MSVVVASRATVCLTEDAVWKAIKDHVAELVAAGLVLETGWPGRPFLITPVAHGPDVVYDREKVEHVLKVCRTFEHLKGKWARHPLNLFDWQVTWEVAPVFGLCSRSTGKRIVRTAYVEKPRKNGKSTECSAFGLVLAFADGEEGAEVYAAAKDKQQARVVFQPAKTMAERSAPLRKKLGARGIQRSLLENPSTTSIFRPLAADMGGNLHGLNVHGGIIDELHVHRNSDTIDAIETGTGSREQPLIIIITTADDGKVGSPYDTKRSYVEQLCSRTIVDPSFYGVVFAASVESIELRPFDTATLIEANPGYGYTVSAEYLEGKAREAQASPAQLNRYLRLHLGKRTKQTIKWLDMPRWDAAMGTLELDEFRGRIGYGGLDLSATTDLTAAVILCPLDTAEEGYIGRLLAWIPEERIDDLERLCLVPFRRWIAEGFLTATEGNVVDYAKVREDFGREVDVLGVRMSETAYDPWNAAETVQELEKAGYTMVPIRQGYGSLSGPSKELERLVMGSRAPDPETGSRGLALLRFGYNPLLRWMADCVEVMQDPAGNIKPAKPDRRKASQRIDGIAAAVNALARAMLRTPPKRKRSAGGSA